MTKDGSIPYVKQSVINIPRGRDREQRLSRVIHARRRLNSPRGGGRAWINGREVGGTDPRYAHLETSND
ncbi:MAG: hypothetical protein WKF29_08140 [Thermoleophilaceae bacterium]